MQVFSRVFSVLTNKYLAASVIFAMIILFTDHNNLFEQMKRKSELNDLIAKKDYFQKEITKTKKELSDLSNNAAAIEKYAREKFLMKRDNEDVFVIEPPSSGTKN